MRHMYLKTKKHNTHSVSKCFIDERSVGTCISADHDYPHQGIEAMSLKRNLRKQKIRIIYNVGTSKGHSGNHLGMAGWSFLKLQ